MADHVPYVCACGAPGAVHDRGHCWSCGKPRRPLSTYDGSLKLGEVVVSSGRRWGKRLAMRAYVERLGD